MLVVAANGMVTGRFGWTPGGFALSFGRMLQDGIVKRYLDAHCPDATLRLCPYKNELPRDADDFFWGGGSIFNKLGRFEGYSDEMRRIVLASFADDPLLQLKSIVSETAKQLVEVRTGAGVVKWAWDTYFIIKDYTPAAVPAMQAARQQRSGISFTAINLVQVPVAWFAMALLPFIAGFAWRRAGLHDIGEFAAAMAFAILGNAAVFGALATAHNRYGARMAWIAVLVVLIALARIMLNRPRSETPGLPV